MKVDEWTSEDVHTSGGGEHPPCAGLTSNALPEAQSTVSAESSQTGVSTRNALCGTDDRSISSSTYIPFKRKPKDVPHWYALRVTYGREKKVYDYLVSKNVEAFYPTITTIKLVDGKRKTIEESRLPNIFFARGTEDESKPSGYDNVDLRHLRFYYRHLHEGARIIKRPLVVPEYQIESLKIICASEAEDIILVPLDIKKFKAGQTVRVIEGVFKGVIGKVARFQGQQRIGIVIDGLMTVASAYVPSAFLENIIKDSQGKP